MHHEMPGQLPAFPECRWYYLGGDVCPIVDYLNQHTYRDVEFLGCFGHILTIRLGETFTFI